MSTGHSLLLRRYLVAALCLALAPTTATGGDIGSDAASVYIGWLQNEETIRIVPPTHDSSEGEIWLGDDGSEVAEFCADDSDYFCFRSSRYSFAVPKSRKWPDDHWTHNGISCEVIERGLRVTILGRELPEVNVLRCHAPNVPGSAFAFSLRDGLIAIGVSSTGWDGTYWLEGTKGFGVVHQRDGD